MRRQIEHRNKTNSKTADSDALQPSKGNRSRRLCASSTLRGDGQKDSYGRQDSPTERVQTPNLQALQRLYAAGRKLSCATETETRTPRGDHLPKMRRTNKNTSNEEKGGAQKVSKPTATRGTVKSFDLDLLAFPCSHVLIIYST
jgi:hypothetical protein